MSYFQFPRYVSVAEKRAHAEKKRRQLMKKHPDLAPVIIDGNALARTWWGKAWNGNLERYADYHNRIARGRSYVRHQAVLDLKIHQGRATALVQGSQSTPYTVEITIGALPASTWAAITRACADQLASLQDLLAGRFPEQLAHLFMQKGSGLFPSPQEIQFTCSCPDWAYMCKHVAAVLYGIGARLDQDPTLFFHLRQVNMDDLVTKAIEDTTAQWLQKAEERADQPTIAEADLGALFGLDMDATAGFNSPATGPASSPRLPGDAPPPTPRRTKGNPRQPTVPSPTDAKTRILALVNAAAKGITASELHQQSGIDIVKIRNTLYQAHRNGTIAKVRRGVFCAKRSRSKPAAAAKNRTAAPLKGGST